jgi:hypothetical protein
MAIALDPSAHSPSGIALLQWPAMAVTLVGTWYLASTAKHWRLLGFWASIIANALWVAWGVHDHAYAVIAMNVTLAALNVRGVCKAQPS